MTIPLAPRISDTLPPITWEKLPADFVLPDEPVESTRQPLLAAAWRESLELASLIVEASPIAANFGICATVGGKTVVKAPDWVYVPAVAPIGEGEIRRSYTTHAEGEVPAIVMEFISETEGGEYSINPHYPYGKWYFYERILQVPVYIIFQPQSGELEVYRLVSGKYELQKADEDHRYWRAEIGLFLGVWQGKKAAVTAHWLRWWDQSGNLLLWGSERIEQTEQRAEQAERRAEGEKARADRLAAQLKARGIDLEAE
ncbi:Uma2 family endonuclease [Microcystis aeruginosa CS-1036]|uniref:Uma2 family endonuclease n=1 Tax=Microcystis TaxID=1125 RepID=UPI00232EB101|nr:MULTISPECIES: Uma2 family endonuclease [Microcystis]MDB9404676.1 Uma2 family endonuclease [Microcystis sp. CS-574]MDB9543609.1 Uma2 family endonuclease [Microcystis aeruginosa CS-1036]